MNGDLTVKEGFAFRSCEEAKSRRSNPLARVQNSN